MSDRVTSVEQEEVFILSLVTHHLSLLFHAPAIVVSAAAMVIAGCVAVMSDDATTGCRAITVSSDQRSLKSLSTCAMSALISSVMDFFSRMLVRRPGCE